MIKKKTKIAQKKRFILNIGWGKAIKKENKTKIMSIAVNF
jgi:hypothetical protein